MVKPIKIISHYIFDGDTLSVTETSGQQYKTRARWIDAPEVRKSNEVPQSELDTNQWKWGEKSRSYLSEILQGQNLFIIPWETDQYGRTIADWYVGEVKKSGNVQTRMVGAGMAIDLLPFKRYNLTYRDLTVYMSIIRAQYKARQKQLGVWQDSEFMIPSEWRKTRLST